MLPTWAGAPEDTNGVKNERGVQKTTGLVGVPQMEKHPYISEMQSHIGNKVIGTNYLGVG